MRVSIEECSEKTGLIVQIFQQPRLSTRDEVGNTDLVT